MCSPSSAKTGLKVEPVIPLPKKVPPVGVALKATGALPVFKTGGSELKVMVG